jgi:hypothetical protein
MNKILVVIPFSVNDAILAEHLCDWIFLLNKRVQKGHALLVVAGDVHAEMRAKVELAAQVAFETVVVVSAPAVVSQNKNVHVNTLFRVAAETVARRFTLPWLWLEPDTVPLKAGWLKAITDAHYSQPKRYSGSWMKASELFLARVAVYPHDAINDLEPYLNDNSMFNMNAGQVIIPASTKTRLVQEVAIWEESTTINPEAVVLHRDKSAVLMTSLREKMEQSETRKK